MLLWPSQELSCGAAYTQKEEHLFLNYTKALSGLAAPWKLCPLSKTIVRGKAHTWQHWGGIWHFFCLYVETWQPPATGSLTPPNGHRHATGNSSCFCSHPNRWHQPHLRVLNSGFTGITAERLWWIGHYKNYKFPLHNLNLRRGHFWVQDFSKTS